MAEEYKCPISHNLPVEPVIASDVSVFQINFFCILDSLFLSKNTVFFDRARFTRREQLSNISNAKVIMLFRLSQGRECTKLCTQL